MSQMTPEERAELESHLEPIGWEPPQHLTVEDVLKLAAEPDKTGAEVLGWEEPVYTTPFDRLLREAFEAGQAYERDAGDALAFGPWREDLSW